LVGVGVTDPMLEAGVASGVTAVSRVVSVLVVVVEVSFCLQPRLSAATPATVKTARVRILFMVDVLLKKQPPRAADQPMCKKHSRGAGPARRLRRAAAGKRAA